METGVLMSLQNLFMLDTGRGYATLFFFFFFLVLKSIPNSPTICNEFHLSSFRGKKIDTESGKPVFESQLNHILLLGQIISLSLSSANFFHL